MELERKFLGAGAGLRLGDELVAEGAVIEGYASLFGVPDRGGDVVAAGAYRASLSRMAQRGGRVKMLWQHDPLQPIGVWDEVVEDARGLRVRGRLLDAVARGREAAALVKAGALDGLSIGYRTVASTAEGRGRRLVEIDLWEISLVTFPMLGEARVAAKAAAPEDGWAALAAVLERGRAALVAQGPQEGARHDG
ncbi:HK97 family phage prohead protease [Frigidibacter sp. MR17.14]|uniref:HK97 family phage prohead protease n=1 Tax=Frigidibacter sp. MR17.14 TaxID=3126509 RepID=UPI003012C820